MRTTIGLGLLLAALVCLSLDAQESTARARFQAGKFQETADAVRAEGDAASPGDVYLAAQSLSRLNKKDEARDTLQKLDKGDHQNAWTYITRSAIAQLDGDLDTALTSASRATELGPDNAYAYYQLGVVTSLRNDFNTSAGAFERVTQIDNNDAYAHYYAGIAYNKVRRADQMLRHFRAFVSLAPSAPERPQVEVILRTVR